MRPRIYVVHGWAYDLSKWEKLMTYLKSKDVEPTMLKVPGLTAPSKEIWDLQKYTDWLKDQTKSAKQPFVLVGHSNGGRICANFVIQNPERVRQLILIDSAGVHHDQATLKLRLRMFKAAAKAGKKITRSPKLKKLLYKASRAHDYERAPENMKQTMVNLQRDNKNLHFEEVRVPTTIIWGEDDKLTPLSDGKQIHEQIKGSKLQVIKEGRHSPFYTNPEIVGDTILELLR
ncbi:alpha/beta hydrolase [Candidatus Saccharibacteria bacterium]|nr:alpha/beta hydrolase [Candidatus Saccharibacteria bacterium]